MRLVIQKITVFKPKHAAIRNFDHLQKPCKSRTQKVS